VFKLDLQSRQPIYEQLKNKIGEMVMIGSLSPDAQLPSVRSLARELGINPNTVQKAYQDLERDKIIYSVAGRGSYISHEIGVVLQLEKGHLQKVEQVVELAKRCGISQDQVEDTVRMVYMEGSQ